MLSTVHGRQRRELRDITKHDLRTVMKYGTKSKGNFVNGDQRWKFEFGNTVYITDNTCKKEITCYKKAIDIQPAQITEQMWSNHHKAVRILKNDPQLVSALCLVCGCCLIPIALFNFVWPSMHTSFVLSSIYTTVHHTLGNHHRPKRIYEQM